MAAYWNLQCQGCHKIFDNVQCSMFNIPPCECGSERRLISSRTGRSTLFPFTVNHVDGKPMVIESLNQLRNVERDYGVVFTAFSRDNWQDTAPVDKNLPQFRGEDPGVRSKYRR